MISKYLAAVAATALVAAPVAAAPASLSVAKSVRAGAVSKHKDDLAGRGLIVAILAAVAVGVGIYVVADSDDEQDSN